MATTGMIVDLAMQGRTATQYHNLYTTVCAKTCLASVQLLLEYSLNISYVNSIPIVEYYLQLVWEWPQVSRDKYLLVR